MVSSGNSRHAAFFSALRSVAVNSLAPDAEACPAVIANFLPGPCSRTPGRQGAGNASHRPHLRCAADDTQASRFRLWLKISVAQQLRRLFGGIPVVHSTLLDPEARDPFTTFGDFATVYPEMQNSRFRL
jgi:hypothetical protein